MLLNTTQFIFHASFFKLICAKLGIDWTSAPLAPVKLFVAAKTPDSRTGVYSYTTPGFKHLKLPDDAFVSVVTADARSIVNLVCLFMKQHLLALL